MSENSGAGMGDGAQDSLGLLAWIHAEPAVDARHNEIKAVHHVVGIIKQAICKDI